MVDMVEVMLMQVDIKIFIKSKFLKKLMTTNFDPQLFIQDVMERCGFNDASPDFKKELEQAILLRLSRRIIDTVTNCMEEKDFEKYEKLMANNENMDPFDALIQVAQGIPGVDEKLDKALLDLFEELVYDSDRLDDAITLRSEIDKFTAGQKEEQQKKDKMKVSSNTLSAA